MGVAEAEPDGAADAWPVSVGVGLLVPDPQVPAGGLRAEEVLLVVRQAPGGHDRAAAADDAGVAGRRPSGRCAAARRRAR
jgi:hypothetical protein